MTVTNKQGNSLMKPSLGVLNLSHGESKFSLTRYSPSKEIGLFVKHYWIVHWDLTGNEPFWQEIIPNPCVNLVFERNRTGIFGIKQGKSGHLLQDKGQVFGVKFKPGGFYPFYQQSVSRLTNGSVGFEDVFGVKTETLEEIILTQVKEEKMVELVEDFLQPRLPVQDAQVDLVNQIIEMIQADSGIVKVDDVCDELGINKRKLQRLFKDYVGVSPKWVIKLYRLQQAAEKMERTEMENLTQLAIDLGYYDQSHFIKDFKNFIGKSPLEYSLGIGSKREPYNSRCTSG